MPSTSSKTIRTSRKPAVQLTERDIAIGVSAYRAPQLVREHVEQLHFPNLAHKAGVWRSSAPVKRLALLSDLGFLNRRRLPVAAGTGASPYCYTLGPEGVPWVADALDAPLETVRQHQVKAAHFSFTMYPHRRLLADAYVAFALGCRALSYSFAFTSEQELTATSFAATVAGKRVAVRPDAFSALGHLPGGKRSAMFWEIQVASDPGKWLAKARAYAAWFLSGRCEQDWGYRTMRVLGITTSAERAQNLWSSITADAGLRSVANLFWVTSRQALLDDVWGPIWRVAGQADERYQLV